MHDTPPASNLFQGIHLQNISVKNRVVRSATNDYAGNTDGTISDNQIDICRVLAKNEVGLLITANFYISPNGKADRFQNSIHDDRYIDGMKKLVQAVKEYNCKIIAQISHAGAKAYCEGMPSSVLSVLQNTNGVPIPTPLSVQEIEVLTTQFIQAAYRAKCAGFDGVQVHCAHGYLLSEFISPLDNRRTDLYGGSAENRFRMASEIVMGIKKVCGRDFPVFIKINSNIPEGDEAYMDDAVFILRRCKALGVEAVELSGYDFMAFDKNQPPYYLTRASASKKQVDIPLILVGGIKSLEDMENILNEGVDLVALSRPFICEPDLLPKLIAGQKRAACLSCNKCFTLYKTSQKRCVFSK